MPQSKHDSDVSTWSPEGRIHQVEYAMQAINQGSAVVGVKSKQWAILVAIKKAFNALVEHQEKTIKLDDRIGMAIAGLESDGRVLGRFLQETAASYKWTYGTEIPTAMLKTKLFDKIQPSTQIYGMRPYGAGLLIASYDVQGTHLLQVNPSAQIDEVSAWANGNRSQAAKTYLEEHIKQFPDASRDELIKHALAALRLTLSEGQHMTEENISIASVGQEKFKILPNEDVKHHIEEEGSAEMDQA